MVNSYGGADKVPVNKELVLRARRSNAAYKEHLKKAEEEEKARSEAPQDSDYLSLSRYLSFFSFT